MPKIRLSALATDIKGKAGGSVFSSNSGGTYFRNNPSGGGRKSSAWDHSKSALGALSGAWRSLTNDQQEAWRSAVGNWPTTNAFGEPRTPSGYELFMRLNTTLVNLGNDYLVTPPAPRAMPNYGAISIDVPDAFQFTPQFGYEPITECADGADECETSENCAPEFNCIEGCCIYFEDAFLQIPYIPVIDFQQSFSFAMTMNLDISKSVILDRNIVYPLFASQTDEADSYYARIEKEDETKYNLHVRLVGTGYDRQVKWNLPIEYLDSSMRFVVSVNLATLTSSQARINNELLTITLTETIGEPIVPASLKAYVGYMPGEGISFATFQDVRFFNGILAASDAKLVSYGYELGSEVLWYDLNYFGSDSPNECSTHSDCAVDEQCWRGNCVPFNPDGTIELVYVNYGSEGSATNATLRVEPNINQLRAPLNRLYPPIMTLQTEFVGVVDSVIDISASAPLSAGKSIHNVPLKRISVQSAAGVKSYEIGEAFIDVFKSISNDSQVAIGINTILLDNGDKNKPTIKDKPRRFKVGTDLSTKG